MSGGVRGMDIHGGLRVWLEYDQAARTLVARASCESGGHPAEDVEQELARLRQRVGFLKAWLRQWRRQAKPPEGAA